MRTKLISLILVSLSFFNTKDSIAQSIVPEKPVEKLVVIWTSDDPLVAERVAFMYTQNAKKNGWFGEVTLVIWGPSQKLTADNIKIQESLKAMLKDGVVLEACISCSNAYGVTDILKNLGVDVKGMGKPLTGYLKSGAKVITF